MSQNTTMTFQLPKQLKKKIDKSSKKAEISTALWIRQTLKKAAENT